MNVKMLGKLMCPSCDEHPMPTEWAEDKAEIESLRGVIRAMHVADDEYGCGFYSDDKWLTAYRRSRAMVMGSRE